MKTLSYHLYPETNTTIGTRGFRHYNDRSSGFFSSSFFDQKYLELSIPALEWDDRPNRLLTDKAAAEVTRGGIPDMTQVCLDLYGTFLKTGGAHSAAQFIPILKELQAFDSSELKLFVQNPETRHVLVQNALLKVVLIHWKPGTFSDVHGHPRGGCVFKVLNGSLEEKRYTTDESQQLISVSTLHRNGMAYIDDNMAYHAVGNPYDTSAISLHVYTPGQR